MQMDTLSLLTDVEAEVNASMARIRSYQSNP